MILPTIIRTSEEAIHTVPPMYREVSFSLGGQMADHDQSFNSVSPSGIATGIILGIGRSVAETAASDINRWLTLQMPTSLFSPARTDGSALFIFWLVKESLWRKLLLLLRFNYPYSANNIGANYW